MIAVPSRHKFSVDSLLLMEKSGVFPADQRIELLNGEIIDMSPINPPHATCLRKLLHTFREHLPAKDYIIDLQSPLRLSDDSLPQPDLVVANYQPELFQLGHLQGKDVRLVIEVADSTYHYDRYTKFKAYASTGIIEYWIVNLKKSQLEVYTSPIGEAYTQTRLYKEAFTTTLGFHFDLNNLLSF